MSSPSSQPFSYQRFDPLNDAQEETRLPALDESASNLIPTTQNTKTTSGNANGVNVPVSDSETMTEVEERRARHLLDRAFALWEKGDNAAAILACRQSLTIDSNAAGAYSMLGLLLERAGDVKGAIDAYDKAVEIAPDSVLERDSARRLRAASRGSAAPMFHFEDAELFDTSTADISASNIFTDDISAPTEPETSPQQPKIAAPATTQATSQVATMAAPTPANVSSSSTRSATPSAAITPNAMPPSATTPEQNVAPIAPPTTSLPTISSASMSGPQASDVANAPSANAVPATAVPVTQRAAQPVVVTAAAQRQPSALGATARPLQPTQAIAPRVANAEVRANGQAVVSQTVVPQAAVPTVSPFSVSSTETLRTAAIVATPAIVAEGAPGVLATWQGARTFWMRSLPLVAVAGTSFLFLLWSRGVALERERQAVSSVATSTVVSNAEAPNAITNLAPAQSTNNNVANIDAPNSAMTGANTSSTGNNVNGTGASSAQSTSPRSVVPAPNAPTAPATPTGLIVNNAPPGPTATNTNRAKTPNATTGRDVSRRDEPRRERRARRSDNASGEVERAASRSSNPTSPMPDASSIPPASVSGLPRLSNDSGVSPPSSTGALPPVTGAPSSEGNNEQSDSANNGTPSDSGPLPSFPSPADIQSRAQEQMRERASSNVPLAGNPSVKAEDTAYKYQTRALIYIGQGNNARAASDFQSAIALYRRQIARGDRVDEAQRGLQACRDGLMLITTS